MGAVGVYMLDAVHDTATWTTKKIKAMRELLHRATTHVREEAPVSTAASSWSWSSSSHTAASATSSPRVSRSANRVGVSQGIV